jgi:hypothetical protein
MPAIVMCKGTDCPLKNDCHRYNAKPNRFWQAYYIYIPFKKEKGMCHKYWPIDKYTNV